LRNFWHLFRKNAENAIFFKLLFALHNLLRLYPSCPNNKNVMFKDFDPGKVSSAAFTEPFSLIFIYFDFPGATISVGVSSAWFPTTYSSYSFFLVPCFLANVGKKETEKGIEKTAAEKGQ
jgi:hypothetical protein